MTPTEKLLLRPQPDLDQAADAPMIASIFTDFSCRIWCLRPEQQGRPLISGGRFRL
jgi:hypothetical protein